MLICGLVISRIAQNVVVVVISSGLFCWLVDDDGVLSRVFVEMFGLVWIGL